MGVFNRNNRPLVNLAARRWCRQGKIDKATLKAILENDDLGDAVLAFAEEQREVEGVAGPLTDFFDWLLANSDKIIAFVTKLIALFSAP